MHSLAVLSITTYWALSRRVSVRFSQCCVCLEILFKYGGTAFESNRPRTVKCVRPRLRLRWMRILMVFRYGRRRWKSDALELQKRSILNPIYMVRGAMICLCDVWRHFRLVCRNKVCLVFSLILLQSLIHIFAMVVEMISYLLSGKTDVAGFAF